MIRIADFSNKLLQFSVLGFLLFLATILAEMIPNPPIQSHVVSSLPSQEYITSPTGFGQLDMWTECNAVTIGLPPIPGTTPLKRAILAPTYGNCENSAKGLNDSLGGFYYWRFWHGYQIITRPILYFGSIELLRQIGSILFTLSFVAFLMIVAREVGTLHALALAGAIICVPMYSQSILISHGLDWIIAFIGGSYILVQRQSLGLDNRKSISSLFMVAGMLTSYFSYLTNPVITLSLPLLAFWWKAPKEQTHQFAQLKSFIAMALYWSAGYFGFWAVKWLLVMVYMRPADVLHGIFAVIAFRMDGKIPWNDNLTPSYYETITAIWSQTRFIPEYIGVCWMVSISTWWKNHGYNSLFSSADRSLSGIFVFLIPFLWFVVAKQHSVWHAWFVSPIIVPSLTMLGCVLLPMPPKARAP